MSKSDMRKAFRSGFQFCPVCGSQSKLRAHHINRHISEDDCDIVTLCPSCYDQCHSGDIIIESWAMTSHGRVLLWHGKNSNPITDRKSEWPLHKNLP